uniref:Uncharacterized protein n=1 Tax=Arundo donax TaxID=35708 RepID=A0A0A9HIR9_ARUDO
MACHIRESLHKTKTDPSLMISSLKFLTLYLRFCKLNSLWL